MTCLKIENDKKNGNTYDVFDSLKYKTTHQILTTMKYIPLILLFLACKQQETKPKNISPKDLLGKTIEYKYGEAIYHVTFDTDSTMHWQAMADDEKGAYENETYFMESIGENRLFITWDEANGIGVAQVLDFNLGKVYNHLLNNRKLSNGYGTIRVLP
jgi:hypothetical protein